MPRLSRCNRAPPNLNERTEPNPWVQCIRPDGSGGGGGGPGSYVATGGSAPARFGESAQEDTHDHTRTGVLWEEDDAGFGAHDVLPVLLSTIISSVDDVNLVVGDDK